MKLYYAVGACSMAAHIVVKELNIPCELESVDLKTHKTQDGNDYYRINPKGYVPALERERDGLLTEAAAVLFYLTELKSSAPHDRYRLLEWLVFVSTELHKGLGALFSPVISPDAAEAARERVRKRLEFVNQKLAGRESLLDTGFSAADAYLFTVLNWSGKLKVDLSPFQNVRDYMKIIADRPSVQEAMREEGLL